MNTKEEIDHKDVTTHEAGKKIRSTKKFENLEIIVDEKNISNTYQNYEN